jgi:hypothetical protein
MWDTDNKNKICFRRDATLTGNAEIRNVQLAVTATAEYVQPNCGVFSTLFPLISDTLSS